MSLQTRAEHRG